MDNIFVTRLADLIIPSKAILDEKNSFYKANELEVHTDSNNSVNKIFINND